MNEIRPRDRETEEIARIREIVRHHALPDFVTGFDVRLGDFEGDPAVWIVFAIQAPATRSRSATDDIVASMNNLVRSLRYELLDKVDGRYPFFRFETASVSDVPAA